MALLPIEVPPGVSANGTQYQTQGRYFRANLVRWANGVLRPIGGWQRVNGGQPFTGRPCGAFAWRNNQALRYMAIGTHSNLYAWSDFDVLEDITPTDLAEGRELAIFGAGYSFGDYGVGTYGTPRTADDTSILSATTWSFDNWGENLLGVSNFDGRIFEWVPGSGVPAEPLLNAPEQNSAVVVTPERHVVALAADGNPRKVQWSDRENNTQWAPASTNLAGDLELQTTGRILTAVRIRGETLVLTDQDAHLMRFVGSPFVYGIDLVGSGCGVASRRGAVATDSFAVWMGVDGWYYFDGSTVQTLGSEVHEHVFGSLNVNQVSKIEAGVNVEFDEIWWFYPSADSDENDRYVAWNYRENHWTIGNLARSAWVPAGVFTKPYVTAFDGYFYSHENGWTANGTPILDQRFVESGAVELGNGDRFVVARQMIPDEATQGQTRATFKLRHTPNAPEQVFGPYEMADYVDVRFTARQVVMRIEGAADADWRVGLPRLDVVEGSRR